VCCATTDGCWWRLPRRTISSNCAATRDSQARPGGAHIETFAHGFTLVDQRRVSTAADLDAAAVQDVLFSIYRPIRSRPVEAMRVTFSLDLLLFRAA